MRKKNGIAPSPRSWIGGVPQPTEAEIAEGKALRMLLMEPEDECLQHRHRQTWNALQAQRGGMGLLRCNLCRTSLWGHLRGQPCPICKCKSSSYPGENE